MLLALLWVVINSRMIPNVDTHGRKNLFTSRETLCYCAPVQPFAEVFVGFIVWQTGHSDVKFDTLKV